MTTREKGFIFAQLAETAEECFVHKSTVPPELWHDLKPGDGITCKVQETSKGLRGYEVAVADAEEFRRYQTHQRTRS